MAAPTGTQLTAWHGIKRRLTPFSFAYPYDDRMARAAHNAVQPIRRYLQMDEGMKRWTECISSAPTRDAREQARSARVHGHVEVAGEVSQRLRPKDDVKEDE